MNIYGVCKVFRVPHNKHLIDPLHARYYYCLHDGARYRFTRWVASGISGGYDFRRHSPIFLLFDLCYYRITFPPFFPFLETSFLRSRSVPEHFPMINLNPSRARIFENFNFLKIERNTTLGSGEAREHP